MTDNLKLWNAVCETDPEHAKEFKGKGGFKGTAVCAQSQRRKATEMWGPFGTKEAWGVTDETYEFVDLSEDFHDRILIYKGTLFYPGGEVPIVTEIDVWTYVRSRSDWTKNNDIHKKVRTDALTKGLSELGFSADVFLGKFDDDKYINEMRGKATIDEEKIFELEELIGKASNIHMEFSRATFLKHIENAFAAKTIDSLNLSQYHIVKAQLQKKATS